MSIGLQPERWRCQVFDSVIREKLLKLLTAKLRTVVRFECKGKSISVERMIATSESTVIIYDYEQTFSSVKRTHQVYGDVLPGSSRWLYSFHGLRNLKLSYDLASMTRYTPTLCLSQSLAIKPLSLNKPSFLQCPDVPRGQDVRLKTP